MLSILAGSLFIIAIFCGIEHALEIMAIGFKIAQHNELE